MLADMLRSLCTTDGLILLNLDLLRRLHFSLRQQCVDESAKIKPHFVGSAGVYCFIIFTLEP